MIESEAGQTPVELIRAGNEALTRGAWKEARTCFEAALQQEVSPEALEGLSTAAWWLEDSALITDASEQAYRGYLERGDFRSAARMAISIMMYHTEVTEELAVANGWLQRAQRLLQSLDAIPEHGWVILYKGMLALAVDNDQEATLRCAREASSIGRSLELHGLQMQAIALEGIILVRQGKVSEGLSLMDEATAMALSGNPEGLHAVGATCCFLMYTCEAIADYERAAQWCSRAKEFCQRWQVESLFSVCRNYYSAVLLWQGMWSEAEAELGGAIRGLGANRSATAKEATARLADVRRRQGRLDEAEALLSDAESHPMALFVRAALELDRGDASSAVDLIQRFLRRISDEDRAEHVFALEMLVRAYLDLDRLQDAAEAVEEARRIAALVGTYPLRAFVSLMEGLVAQRRGEYETARCCLEDAVDLFERSEAPFEAARARIELGRALQMAGRFASAIRELQAALSCLERLGAAFEAERAQSLMEQLAEMEEGWSVSSPDPSGLTRRELEVLRLIATGKSNQEIAAELVLSIRTVERHISTIYEKIGAKGKVARVIATAYATSHGLAQPHKP